MNTHAKRQPVHVLIVGSDTERVVAIRRALNYAGFTSRLHHVGDDREALAYLRRSGPYILVPRPNFILLDANLPRSSIRGFLAAAKAEPDFRHTPVVLLTTRDAKAAPFRPLCDSLDGTVTQTADVSALARALLAITSVASVLVGSAGRSEHANA